MAKRKRGGGLDDGATAARWRSRWRLRRPKDGTEGQRAERRHCASSARWANRSPRREPKWRRVDSSPRQSRGGSACAKRRGGAGADGAGRVGERAVATARVAPRATTASSNRGGVFGPRATADSSSQGVAASLLLLILRRLRHLLPPLPFSVPPRAFAATALSRRRRDLSSFRLWLPAHRRGPRHSPHAAALAFRSSVGGAKVPCSVPEREER